MSVLDRCVAFKDLRDGDEICAIDILHAEDIKAMLPAIVIKNLHALSRSAEVSHVSVRTNAGQVEQWGVYSYTACLIRRPVHDTARYPHTCPKCGAPAYIGLNQVDCLSGCR